MRKQIARNDGVDGKSVVNGKIFVPFYGIKFIVEFFFGSGFKLVYWF